MECPLGSSGTLIDEGEIKFVDDADRSTIVSADVLWSALKGLQTTVLILGAQGEGLSVDQRFKPASELREHYRLMCHAPQAGSYAMPVELRDCRIQADLGPGRELLKAARSLLEAIRDGSQHEAARLLPDAGLRAKALREVARFLPRQDAKWKLSFAAGSETPVVLDGAAVRTVNAWLRAPSDTAVATITGQLIRVDFEENKLVIRYFVTNREIDCFANEDVIDELVESRKEPVQVTGTFTLDDEDQPMKLTGVFRVESVDLSPVALDSVPLERGRRLTATPPVLLTPHLDEESHQYYVVEEPELGIHSVAQTRDVLLDEIADDVAFLWDAYAEESEARLTTKARELGQRLRNRFSVAS